MKLATATFLLGASSVAADLTADGIVTFNSLDGSGTQVQIQNVNDNKVTLMHQNANRKVVCTRNAGFGNAYAGYTASLEDTAEVVFPKSDIKDGLTFAYKCEVHEREDETSAFQPLVVTPGGVNSQWSFDGQGVRIVLEGSCTSTDNDAFSVTSISNNNYAPNTRLYQPTIEAERTYSCIQQKDHSITAEAFLKNVKLDGLDSDIVGDQDLKKTVELETTVDGLTYTMSSIVQFDVGTDRPHVNYFQEQPDGCNALCKGVITLTTEENGDSKSAGLDSFFSTTYASSAQKYEFSDCATSGPYMNAAGEFTRTGIYTMATVCASTASQVNGALNDVLDCPYDNGAVPFTSQEKDMKRCLAAADDPSEAQAHGKNLCGAQNTGGQEQIIGSSVTNRFKIKLRYTGRDKGDAVSKCDLQITDGTSLSSETTVSSVTFTCAQGPDSDGTNTLNNDFSDMRGFYLVGADGSGNTIRKPIANISAPLVFSLPRSVHGYTFTLHSMYTSR